MNLHHLKQAILNLTKKRSNAFISLTGLSIAFAAIFHIYSILAFEIGYDGFNEKADRIYRISGDIIAAENTMTHAVLGPLMGPGLKDEFPAVEEYTRMVPIKQMVKLEAKTGIFDVEEAYTVDPSIFKIFTINFVYGNSAVALQNPDEIVINESLSNKIYGQVNPIGEIIERDGTPLKIVGVIKDSPANAHHKLNVLFSMGNQWTNLEHIPKQQLSEGYWMPNCYVFVLLQEKTRIEDITDNFHLFYDKYMALFGDAINAKFSPVAIPLEDVHFSRDMSYDYPKGSRTYTYIFSAIGLFILLIAFFNYSNLLVFQNIDQAKNIGIRKINGANQIGIYTQFFYNSLTAIFVAIVFGGILYTLTIQLFSNLAIVHTKSISLKLFLGLSGILLIVLSFFSSLIPFFNQYSKSGIKLLLRKEQTMLPKNLMSFRYLSTTLQFSMAILLLIAVLFISKQLTFMVNSNMGFDKENVVMLKLNKTICNKGTISSLKQELMKNPDIESAAFSHRSVGDVMGSYHFQLDRNGKKITKIVGAMGIDYEYIPLMKMELAEGRIFDQNFNDDKFNSVIINEAAIKFCDFKAPVIGQSINQAKIIGVLKDVSFNSLHNETKPVILFLGDQKEGYLNIRLRANANLAIAGKTIQKNWESFFNNEPFEMQFLDNRVKMLYNDDYAKSKLIRLFTLVTLLIALMGLFNISLMQAQQKIKEIGIRKVNGAKISEILTMLNKDFIKYVVIAFVIASPIAYYAMNKWLEGFAYKTSLSWWIFALAGMLALGIALLTVSFQSWKAATRNPVEALRYE